MGVRFLFITSPLIGEAKYCDDHVCLSVCLYLSDSENISETTPPIFTNFFVLATYGRGRPVLALQYVMYFRFIDDIEFARP